MGDKAFDADQLRQALTERGAKAVIPSKCVHIPHDEEAYKWRHLVENYFSKIKEFRGINTRYDKTDTSYEATWDIAATIIQLRSHERFRFTRHKKTTPLLQVGQMM